ncbi:hypothetical protein OA50_04460 [Mameliella alba]|uniref:Uncharacterized protein n=1 Tax=Mameliella alba TaxID=561184 RepID=A0A0B3SKL2_9RHOB|nr:hypothetical protein OA50_04460 [Mameliella alba]
MAKEPPNTPTRGDRVKRRGRDDGRRGNLSKMDDATKWATVEWDDGGGPRMCHLFELERSA